LISIANLTPAAASKPAELREAEQPLVKTHGAK
jgi:hypothetical protein